MDVKQVFSSNYHRSSHRPSHAARGEWTNGHVSHSRDLEGNHPNRPSIKNSNVFQFKLPNCCNRGAVADFYPVVLPATYEYNNNIFLNFWNKTHAARFVGSWMIIIRDTDGNKSYDARSMDIS